MKKVTIKDVARHAGVSIGTVSKVINNKGYVSLRAKESVTDAIRALHYQVNANAQSLKALKTKKVGVIVSDISNYYLMSIAKAVEEMIRSIDYHMILMSHNDDPETEHELLQLILQQQVEALVLIPTGGNAAMVKQVMDSGVPVIAVDRRVNDVTTDLIADDNHYGSYEAVSFLRSLGHTRIAVIYGHTRNSIGLDRYKGAIDALKKGGVFNANLVRSANFTEDEAYRVTTELLLLPLPPTAIYSCNNTMTLGVLQAINDQNFRIPDDISVIAFGDQSQWKLFKPPLTLMTQPAKRIGIEAAVMLKNRLTLEESFPLKEVVIKPQLHIKGSCTSPKTNHKGV